MDSDPFQLPFLVDPTLIMIPFSLSFWRSHSSALFEKCANYDDSVIIAPPFYKEMARLLRNLAKSVGTWKNHVFDMMVPPYYTRSA